MAVKTIDQNPQISDTIQIDIQTTDVYGNPINPYRVDQVVIYFIERNFTSGTYRTYTEKIGGPINPQELTVYYTDSLPAKTYGDAENNPAWISTDPSSALITYEPYDDDGNAQTGVFRVIWNPGTKDGMAKEGDYMICWKWTPLLASPKQSAHISFYVYGDQQSTTVMPSHVAAVGKYEDLLNRYTPDMFRNLIAFNEVTPDVIARMNGAVGKAFNTLEDLVNQILDLIDANATHEMLLPYLSNLFKHKLWSNDPTLWRRQIKRAVQLNKKKGTLSGLQEALASAGIMLQKLTKYWQVVSPSTWTESFVVGDGQTTFKLSKLAILPVNVDNFKVYLRGVDEEEYVELGLSYVSFSNVGSQTTMVWLGNILSSGAITLIEGDIVHVTYQIASVTSQANENYIRALDLMDQRDETTFTYPPKNWNVHLIAEDDPMFDVIIPVRHPFAPPVVWGQVRTEFAYSENIYNMEEFNGSLRNSNLPCDIDRTFVDKCSACQSSSITLDLELEDISEDRLREAEQIIKQYVPFHTQIHSINYSSAVNEFFPPPTEDIEILIQMTLEDFVIIGQGDFNRLIFNINDPSSGHFLRNELSAGVTMATGTATGFNERIVLYGPTIRFDKINITSNNMLEILSGTNNGIYYVESDLSLLGQNTARIYMSPDSIPEPLDTAAFTFRLSNLLWTDAAASIFQDDLFTLTDPNINFTLKTILTEDNSVTPWKIKILSGIYTGTYNIKDVLPNNSLIISGWTGVVNVSNLSYNLVRDDGTTVVLSSSTGNLSVTRRGRVETEELVSWGVVEGDYILYSGSQYKIIGFAASDKSKPYILNYVSGSAGGVTIKVYRRIVDNAIGYVDYDGMEIITSVDYENALSIQDGNNPPATPVESSSFVGNYLVNIGSAYYTISEWDGTTIKLTGPKTSWRTTGTSVSFSLINYIVTSPVFNHDLVEFSQGVDRRGIEPIIQTSSVDGIPLDVCAAILNKPDGIVEAIGAEESISFKIQNRKGQAIEGVIQCPKTA